MTTIAYRDGVMAADSRAYAGDKLPIGWKNKVHVLPNGALLASSSRVPGNTDAFYAWCRDAFAEDLDLREVSSPEDRGVAALMVWPDGTVWFWNDARTFSGPLEGEFFAIGSGEEYAIGAMAAGASAEQAVELIVRLRLDPWTDGPVRTAKLGAQPIRAADSCKRPALIEPKVKWIEGLADVS